MNGNRLPTDTALTELSAQLGEALAARGWRVTTAESCTGGWIGKVLTDVSGSSGWFERGFIVYGNDAKVDLLGVSADTLRVHGAVSLNTVAAMAAGARAAADADLAVAVTGIAGPEGGSADKPVGTVWFGWCRRDGEPDCECHQFDGDRDAVRRASVAYALSGLLDRARE
ncbi:nicotinamide-nucleotide amidase [Arhodomonas sp. AD133]|uniref:nicotinamide-nucleotide amidase n=1 Tax=Arhodomonas sp. AD133 TaxID=3415009 RepID=UPI003EBB7983